MKEKIRQFCIWLIAVGGLVAIDQIVKRWTILRLKGQPPMVLWQGVFELTYVENRGAAFGILQNRQWLFAILTIVIMIGLAYVYFRLGPDKKFRLTRICALVVEAGAAGNFLDRVFRGFVVDMFYFKLIDYPVFNVADCYVVVFGILFCAAAVLRRGLLENVSDRITGKDQKEHGADV